MLQADDRRQQATAELAAREQALADARAKVERLGGKEADNGREPVTAELAAREQELATAREQVQRVHEDEVERHPLLMVGSAVAALAGIGLITGAMLALVWVAFVANWYRKHSAPVQVEAPAASNGSRSVSTQRSTA